MPVSWRDVLPELGLRTACSLAAGCQTSLLQQARAGCVNEGLVEVLHPHAVVETTHDPVHLAFRVPRRGGEGGNSGAVGERRQPLTFTRFERYLGGGPGPGTKCLHHVMFEQHVTPASGDDSLCYPHQRLSPYGDTDGASLKGAGLSYQSVLGSNREDCRRGDQPAQLAEVLLIVDTEHDEVDPLKIKVAGWARRHGLGAKLGESSGETGPEERYPVEDEKPLLPLVVP